MAHDGQLTLSTQELAVASLLRGGDGGHETLGWQASQDARRALEGRGLIHEGALAPELARAMDAIFASGLTLTAEVRIGDRVRTLRAWIEPAQAWSAVQEDASIALRELAPAQVAIWLASFVGVVRRREPWPGGEIGVEVRVLAEAREAMDLRGEGEADGLLARRSGLGRPARAALLALTGEGVAALRALAVERISEAQAETVRVTVINAGALGLWLCFPPEGADTTIRFRPVGVGEVERRLAALCGGRIVPREAGEST